MSGARTPGDGRPAELDTPFVVSAICSLVPDGEGDWNPETATEHQRESSARAVCGKTVDLNLHRHLNITDVLSIT